MSTFILKSRKPILALLSGAGLPTADLPAELPHFVLLYEGETPVACGGLEVYGKHALLRSVAVDPAHQGRGLGGKIVRQLRTTAAAAGVKHLWLLTTDATLFFQKQGFSIVSRDKVPGEILATQQFASLCPASATALSLHL